jgi:Zn finger protein HypA/HybF involved in hydrogenase expression
MHEMGIAQSVIEMVEKEVRSRPGARLRQATVRVGEFSGVDTESLRFCLEVLAADACFRLERVPDDSLDLAELELEIP